MLFPTSVFAVFFLVVFYVYWLLRARNLPWHWFLLAASYVFYGWWDWRFLFLIIASSICNHGFAVRMERSSTKSVRKTLLILSLVFNLGLLGFFKYYSFFVHSAFSVFGIFDIVPPLPLLEIVLPVGISFFTFQALSYVVDVYRREIPPAPSLLSFSVYLAFFPQLVAGPIVRADIFLPQLGEEKSYCPLEMTRAGFLILGGLFKKIVLANTLSSYLADPVFADPEWYGGIDTLLGIYGYALQIYCDFSAYSDIAIGVALLLGFRFPDNFRAPYFAMRFQDFWRRWHISLSTWLRDYLYIPLGGSRKGRMRTSCNLMTTFLLGGLWHGASWRFVVWGALHGFYLSVERFLLWAIPLSFRESRARYILRPIAWLIVFHGVCLSWFFFRADTFADAWIMIGKLGDWQTPSELLGYQVVSALVVGFAVQLLDGGRLAPLVKKVERLHPIAQGALAAVILTLILGLGPQGVAPFIYFQF